jgi:dsDNA-specific endonuclease/ATPase MutS2
MSEPRVPASKASKASIERDIEHTRAELSETVQALADKADVPARVKEKVAATAESAQAAAQQVTHQVQETAQQVTHQVQEGAHVVAAKAADAANQAMDRLPPPVRTRIGQLTATAKRRPVPTALTAAALVAAVLLVLRQLLRRS